MFDRPVDVLIIGAGPYGLSLGSRLRHLGIDYRIVGVPMSFWRQHMPAGMYLRSSWDWHLDPQGEADHRALHGGVGNQPRTGHAVSNLDLSRLRGVVPHRL